MTYGSNESMIVVNIIYMKFMMTGVHIHDFDLHYFYVSVLVPIGLLVVSIKLIGIKFIQ